MLAAENLLVNVLDLGTRLNEILGAHRGRMELIENSIRRLEHRRAMAINGLFDAGTFDTQEQVWSASSDLSMAENDKKTEVEGYLALLDDVLEARRFLDQVDHSSIACFDPAFARAIVEAKGHFYLAEVFARRPGASAHLIETVSRAMERIDKARHRIASAVAFVEGLEKGHH